MKRYVIASTLIVGQVVMAGCVGLSDVKMSTVDREQTKTVKVRAENKLPDIGSVNPSHGAVAGGVGGAAGILLASAISSDGGQIQVTMKSNNIDLPAILRDEFEKALRSRGGFSIVDENAPADAEMVLFVNKCGFLPVHGSRSVLYPFMNVSASLRKPDGTVIWQRTDVEHPQDKGGYRFEDYIEKPEILRGAWSTVSGMVSRNLVEELSD